MMRFLVAISVHCILTSTHGFVLETTIARTKNSSKASSLRRCNLPSTIEGRATCACYGNCSGRRLRCATRSRLAAIPEVVIAAGLADYAPAAASLFNNMKLPAAVVTAGMISLGFATRFPELPRDTPERIYPLEQRQLCSKLDRLHIVLGVISVTSELIVVLWSAVEVNQLTERAYEPAYSVWNLIHRDCDLAWSAVNSHFILGIIGFVGMLWLRAHVMLLSAKASRKLQVAASSGTGAALCLMVSIVNRGVETGGGNSLDSYGHNILDLVSHYVALLLQAATNERSPGLLQFSALVLEFISLSFLFLVLLQESDYGFEERIDEDSSLGVNCDKKALELSAKELNNLNKCVEVEDAKRVRKSSEELLAQITEEEEEETRRKLDDSGDYSSVNIG